MKSFPLKAIATFLSALPAIAQTAPSQAAGYQLLLSEDFSDFDLSPNGFGDHQWYPGLYFQPANHLSSDADAVAVSNSMLDLQWQLSSGSNNTSIEGCAYDASHCSTYRYGYFEARMKWDVTNGAWPAFWMMPKQGILGQQHVGEIDIFEGQGDDPTHYYGTINEWNGGSDLVSSNSPLSNRFQLPDSNDYSQWHTYGLLWVPGSVTWYYDDIAVGTAQTPAIFDQQDFFIIFGSEEGNHWTPGSLASVTAQSINLDVQWLHVFQPPNASLTTVVPRQGPTSPMVPPIVKNGLAVSQGPLPASQVLTITLNLPLRNQDGLDTLLQQLSDPQSTNYHQFLTSNQLTASFGPTEQDYDAVVAWAQSKGLIVTRTTTDLRSVTLSGSVGAINQAFQTTLNSYLDPVNNGIIFSPAQEPTLDLSVQILAIDGLTSANRPRRLSAPIIPPRFQQRR